MALLRIPPAAPVAADDLVSLEEARAHCRVDHTEEDALLAAYLAAAHQYAEAVLRRAVHPGTYELVLERWPANEVELPQPVGARVTVDSVRYVDQGGEEQTLDPAVYFAYTDPDPATVFPAWRQRWPALRRGPGAVRIRFTAAYPAGGVIPGGITTAVLLLVGHWYLHRESVVTGTITAAVPQGVEMLLWPHRLLRFG